MVRARRGGPEVPQREIPRFTGPRGEEPANGADGLEVWDPEHEEPALSTPQTGWCHQTSSRMLICQQLWLLTCFIILPPRFGRRVCHCLRHSVSTLIMLAVR